MRILKALSIHHSAEKLKLYSEINEEVFTVLLIYVKDAQSINRCLFYYS